MSNSLKAFLSGDGGKKKLMVNCGTALILSDREGTLNSFDSIMINCSKFFASGKAYASLIGKGAMVNSGSSTVREVNGEITQLSGDTEVTESMDYTGKFVICSGNAIVRDDGEKAFAGSEGVHVTGAIFYPKERETAFLSKVTGKTVAYPQNAHLVIGDKKLDEILHSVPEGKTHIWVHGEIIALEEIAFSNAKELDLSLTFTSL